MKNKKHPPLHSIDVLFTFSLFCIFTICSAIVIIIGIHVYQETVSQMQDTYSTRTALAYVGEKIKQHDTSGGILLSEIEDETALVMKDTIDHTTYLTYIYPNGDSLYELSVKEGTNISKNMGNKIIEVKDFTIKDKENGFLECSASDHNGKTISILLHPRSTGS